MDNKLTFQIAEFFRPDYLHYEGVRPVNIFLLRLFYFLMVIFVATEAWTSIITHQGEWDHLKAVASCVWASYATLSVFGIIHPLKWLPIMVFMIFYKSIWLFIVAYPLWISGALWGSPAEEMSKVFLMIPLPAISVPWFYFFKTFVLLPKRRRTIQIK